MVEIEFPDWSRRKLERTAVEHGIDVALAYGREHGDAPTDRLVVNMLRHEFTGYDTDPSQENHRAVCESIAARYRWLKPECDRQIRARAQSEAFEREAAEEAEQMWASERTERRARVEQSKQVIGQFREGMQVTASVKGHRRNATVLKVGRTRLTIGFTIKTGADRTAVIHACEVQPA